MKKVVVASLLAVSAISAFSVSPFAASVALAQDAAAPAAGQVQMPPAEFAVYDNAVNKQTTPQTQAPAIEDYLKQFPQSAVKADVLQRLMVAYVAFDHAKAIDAADRLLQVDPGNLRALTFEVFLRREASDALTDPAAKQSALDAAADYAQKGLAAPQPKGMSDADYTALKATATPIFQSAVGASALGKKDYPAAITAFKAELAAMPVAATQQPGQALQDTYFLGQAYYASTPPDLVNCTFYATRAASFAPDNFKAQLQPLATYCYKKYHGGTDGYEAVTAAAQANLNPPAGFSIVPAPTAADIVAKTIASTPDLSTLALSDKEYIIQNGKPEDADKVFATVKGKSVEIPDGVVVDGSTVDKVLVSVSDDAVQGKVADFTFNMKTPLKAVPAVGTKITLQGVYASYTQSPVMLVMSDGEEVVKKAAPAHRAPARHK
ncbi:hypothetical protein FTO74_05905 [Granulicella sp. WH15]|uniref:hypothetical protein n=1 Tax=Granulicella sp. WH15 TaxID=2602070 RepID=UPI001366E55D|nr:hypothetical protein [Granulicella sp. WH15]QHN02954.1 hypothetical protein FTO74_05905 [Granulicella sp. WH15]